MKRKGFTLVEIMIVVAIIALLAAIAIPNLLRARLQANESSAQAALKTIATAEVTFRSANNTYANLGDLGVANPPYTDAVLGCGGAGGAGPCAKAGYNFATTDIAGETFHASGVPVTANVTGVRSFCVTEDGVVRVDPTGAAIASRAACLALAATQP